MVARYVAVGAIDDLARRVAEAIPDRLTLAVCLPRSFNLVRRGGGAPHEILRESHFRHDNLPVLRSYE
jgi:hypothetical protein